jgi:acyl carrier protein
MSEKRHYYNICFQQFADPSKNIEHCLANTIVGYVNQHVTLPDINSVRDKSGLAEKAVLMSVSYLGYMTEATMTGAIDKDLADLSDEPLDDDDDLADGQSIEDEDEDEDDDDDDDDLDEVLASVNAAIADVLNIDDHLVIGGSQNLDDLGVDSLDWQEIQRIIEEDLGVDFGEDLAMPATIRDLVNETRKRLS